MSISLIIITEIFLFLNIYLQFKLLKYKALLHPSMFFCIVWIISMPSYLILSEIDPVMDAKYPELVDELNYYVLFTTICFIIFSIFNHSKVKKNNPKWDISSFGIIFKSMVSISLFGSLLFWISTGSSLSIGNNRNTFVEGMIDSYEYGGQFGFLFSLASVLNSLMLPCAIYVGYIVSKWVFKNEHFESKIFWLILPMVSFFLYSAAIGGRNPLFWGIRYHILGFGFGSLNLINYKSNLRKIMLYTTLIVLLINSYSTFVAADRAKVNEYDIISEDLWAKYPVLKPFSGVIEYMSFHYMGYQYRRVDYVDDELTMGAKTFSGALKASVPLSSTFGLNLNVGNLIGINKIYQIQDIMYSDREWKETTFTSYMLIYDDFGYFGTFVFIILLVWISQIVYVNWFVKTHKGFMSIFPIFMIWCFWTNTNFDPYFASSFMPIVYVFLLIDFILINFIKNKVEN
jgi:hypothetical protein